MKVETKKKLQRLVIEALQEAQEESLKEEQAKNQIEVIYKEATDVSEEESQRRLDRAYEILFTEVDRRLRERADGSKK